VPEYSVPFVLKPAKTFCGLQSGRVRGGAVAGLLEETVIGYDDHSRKEYYEGRKDFRELLRVREKLRRNTLDREGENWSTKPVSRESRR
jgi:hypothetical protein